VLHPTTPRPRARQDEGGRGAPDETSRAQGTLDAKNVLPDIVYPIVSSLFSPPSSPVLCHTPNASSHADHRHQQ
jgi:hypothetical protein